MADYSRKGAAIARPAPVGTVAAVGCPLPVTDRATGGPAMSPETVRDVSAEEGHDLVEAGAVLLDVREADEWEAGHAPEAVWIPMGEVQARADELPRDRRIVAICRAGSRSHTVAEALLGAGYDVVNLDGGMRAWAADFDVVASDGLPGTVI